MLYDTIENLLNKHTITEIENTIKEIQRESAKERELEKYREATAEALTDYFLFLFDDILDPNTDYDEYYGLIMDVIKDSEKKLKQMMEAANLKKKDCKCGGQCEKNTTNTVNTKDKSDEEIIDAFLCFLKNQTIV